MITVTLVMSGKKKKKRKRYFVARQGKRYRRGTQISPFDSKNRNLNVTESYEGYIVSGSESRLKEKLILESYNSIRKQEFVIIAAEGGLPTNAITRRTSKATFAFIFVLANILQLSITIFNSCIV